MFSFKLHAAARRRASRAQAVLRAPGQRVRGGAWGCQRCQRLRLWTRVPMRGSVCDGACRLLSETLLAALPRRERRVAGPISRGGTAVSVGVGV